MKGLSWHFPTGKGSSHMLILIGIPVSMRLITQIRHLALFCSLFFYKVLTCRAYDIAAEEYPRVRIQSVDRREYSVPRVRKSVSGQAQRRTRKYWLEQ